jgi:hypothetical protein
MIMGVEEGTVGFNNPGQGIAPAAAARISGECRTRALEYVGRVLDSFYDVLGKDLADLTADVFIHSDGSRIIDGLRIIQKNREQMTERFHAGFMRGFERIPQVESASPRPPGNDGATSEFSLIDDSELEESLAVNTLIGKMQERCTEELYALEQRYSELSPGISSAKQQLPMGPESFCHAFRDTVAVFDVETSVRVHCYKLIERILMPGIAEFYAGMNKSLIDQGVLPELKARIRTQPIVANHTGTATHHGMARGRGQGSEEGGGNRRAGSGGGGRYAGRAESLPEDDFLGDMVAPVEEQMFQAMQYLLGENYSTAGSASGEGISGVYLPATPMLIDTLSSLQQDSTLIERSGELLRGGLKQHVVGRFATLDTQGRPGVINQIDDETIDVISMIFDYILDDKTLPDFIKALIGRLQIPVLKVAIVDRKFFSDKSHPTRQLLNELAYAGVGWYEESDAIKDRLYEKMEMTVRRVLEEFDHDVSLFEVLLNDFRTFLDEEKKSFALIQQKIETEVHESDQIERIKIEVAEEIANRLTNRIVPEEIRQFLTTTWRQRVSVIALDDTQDGQAKTRALQVMEDLIWSVEPKTTSEQRRRLGVLLPVLLEELREGMRQTGCSEDDIKAFTMVLERCHFSSMKGPKIREREKSEVAAIKAESAAPVAPPSPPDEQGQAKLDEIDRLFKEISGDIENLPDVDIQGLSGFDEFIELKDPALQSSFEKMMAEMGFEAEGDAGPRIDDKHTALVRRLELGSWVELSDADGTKMRVKLAWVGDAYTNYSFVNRQYKVVAERPLYVLANEFRTGKAKLIEDVALFDRALDGVVSGIMKFARSRSQVRHA